jgi:hypothetical protein
VVVSDEWLSAPGDTLAEPVSGGAKTDSSVNRVLADLVDKGLVDLDLVDGETLQVRQRRVAGAEVVDRECDPQ